MSGRPTRRFALTAPLLLLAAVVVYAVARLADPHQRWASIPVGGDRVEHAAVAYLLVMFGFVGFPRVPLWLPATGLIAVGVAVEAAQALPGVVGAPQPGDVVANAIGALAATLPAWLARRRYEAPT
jgi:hypothetical protein